MSSYRNIVEEKRRCRLCCSGNLGEGAKVFEGGAGVRVVNRKCEFNGSGGPRSCKCGQELINEKVFFTFHRKSACAWQ